MLEVTVESLIMNISLVDIDEYVKVVEVWEASVRATHHFLSEDGFNESLCSDLVHRRSD